jgi:hypothetical protein
MEEIIIRGLRIAFEQKGSGTPLVLLHGGFMFEKHKPKFLT